MCTAQKGRQDSSHRRGKSVDRSGRHKSGTLFLLSSARLHASIHDGKVLRNPVSGVSFFPEQHRTRFCSEEELTRLHGLLQPKDWFLVAFAIETGLRRSEMFNLKWNCIDTENGVLTIPLSKSGKTRHVPLSEGAKAILRTFDTFTKSSFVFPSVLDPLKPLCPDSFLKNVFCPALRRTGITGATGTTFAIRPHPRRVMAGVDIASIKDILGHANIQTTMRYAHLSKGHITAAVNRGSLGAALIHTSELNRELNREQGINSEVELRKHWIYWCARRESNAATLSLEG